MITESNVPVLEGRLGPKPGFYHWQRRLMNEQLMLGAIPGAVDVPTGLGKTKVMALWLIALAAGVRLPRRLIYVVDRRAVVDQAKEEAEQLAAALASLLVDEAVDVEMRNHWKKNLGFTGDAGLAISTLRGQFIDNRKWMDRPHAAAIVVGTVDMIGSRLLFSGYGVSRGMRPVHAALLGCDSLVVLDEAHLVPPFEQLLRDVVRITDRDRAKTDNLIPGFRLMSLSATGRATPGISTFVLNDEDLRDLPAQKRLKAEKRLRLLDQASETELPEALAERAWALGEGSRRVLVFCNSRMVAQRVEENLADRARKNVGSSGKNVTELFVGERRLRERMLSYEDSYENPQPSILPQFRPGGKKGGDTALFLVATSAAEVGVDLDADDIVCDLVSWERMVQRFGRVNRRPEPDRARIEIIPSLSEKEAEDEISRDRLNHLRAPFESTIWPEAADGTRDASPQTLMDLKSSPGFAELIEQAQSEEPLRPAISDALIEAWSMTSLREHSGRPIVQPWLRGWIETRPQCRIAWRKHFPLRRYPNSERRESTSDLQDFFDVASPDATELLEAPVYRIADLIKKRIDAWRSRPSVEDSESIQHPPVIVVLDDYYDVEAWWTVDDLKNRKSDWLEREIIERTIIVDARLGGLADSGLLDPEFEDHPLTIDTEEGKDWLRPKPGSSPNMAPQPQWRIRYRRNEAESDQDWKFGGFHWYSDPDIESAEELWIDVWRGADATSGDAAVTRCAQELEIHHKWTQDEATEIATSLAPTKIEMLRLAARLHDLGKDRDLWQDAMNAPQGAKRPYAKTTGGAAPRLLGGYRHEFGSLSDVLKNNGKEIDSLSAEDRELALHIVATHHGHSRPKIRAFDPNQAPSISLDLARDSALRYVRLQQRWGAWGLAWWEALLRSADWTASRRVDASESSDR